MTSTFQTEIATRQSLSTLVRDYLVDLGFDWQASSTFADPYRWERPPLFSQEVLSGRSLQPHLAIPTSLDADGLADVYERFVDGAIFSRRYHDFDIPAWFSRACNIRLPYARLLFVPPTFGQVRLRTHLNLVQFAALVAYNHEVYVEESADEFVVTTREGYRFGIESGGRAVSNMRRPPQARRTSGLVSLTGKLSELARGDAVLPPVSSLFDVTRAFVETKRAELGGEYDAMQIALRALWWRHEGVYPSRLLNMTYRETSVEALRNAVQEARDFDNYDQPLKALQRIFVPQFLSHGAFRKQFGDPYSVTLSDPPSQRMREKWLNAIDQLDPGSKQET